MKVLYYLQATKEKRGPKTQARVFAFLALRRSLFLLRRLRLLLCSHWIISFQNWPMQRTIAANK